MLDKLDGLVVDCAACKKQRVCPVRSRCAIHSVLENHDVTPLSQPQTFLSAATLTIRPPRCTP